MKRWFIVSLVLFIGFVIFGMVIYLDNKNDCGNDICDLGENNAICEQDCELGDLNCNYDDVIDFIESYNNLEKGFKAICGGLEGYEVTKKLVDMGRETDCDYYYYSCVQEGTEITALSFKENSFGECGRNELGYFATGIVCQYVP